MVRLILRIVCFTAAIVFVFPALGMQASSPLLVTATALGSALALAAYLSDKVINSCVRGLQNSGVPCIIALPFAIIVALLGHGLVPLVVWLSLSSMFPAYVSVDPAAFMWLPFGIFAVFNFAAAKVPNSWNKSPTTSTGDSK